MMAVWKKLLIAALVVTLALGSSVVLAGAYIAHEVIEGVQTGDFGDRGFGSVRVYVHDKGPDATRFGIRVPAFLIRTAIRMIPFESETGGLAELKNYLPLLDAIGREFRKSPDGVYVSVDSPTETVRIAKVNDRLVVHVDDPGAEIRLEMPLSCVRTLVRRLERAVART
jgi:hypothetical protein